jgi:Icc-related predicted phosphoesterase
MRCLVVADLHYALPQYDWVIQVASRFDVVIIAGDHLDLGSLVDWRAQTVVVRKYIELLRAKARLITCSGNHDLDSRDSSGEKVAGWISDLRHQGVLSDGQSFTCGDTLITICPWWDGPLVRERVAAQLAADALKRPAHWFWVHHAPPDKSPTSWDGHRYSGDAPLAEWIAEFRPDIVFSGHVHQSPFANGGSWVDRIGETWVFNAGHQFGAPPTHIVIDTEAQQAIWISAAGVQSVRLDRPLERPIAKLTELPDWLTAPDSEDDRIPA